MVEFHLDEFKSVRTAITKALQDKGWEKITYAVKLPSSRSTIDIVATSKGFRKKKVIITIGANEFDANLAIMILTGIREKVIKVMFLQEGNPDNVKASPEIKVLANYDDLPTP